MQVSKQKQATKAGSVEWLIWRLPLLDFHHHSFTGPTNSGKTYHALQRLKAADPEIGGGIYVGPLRLLALEVYDQLNEAGR